MHKITDEESREAGVKKEVYQKWADLMQAFWEASIITYSAEDSEDYVPAQSQNEILIGNRFKMSAMIVNNSFVEAVLWDGETEICKIMYANISVYAIAKCFFICIKSSLTKPL